MGCCRSLPCLHFSLTNQAARINNYSWTCATSFYVVNRSVWLFKHRYKGGVQITCSTLPLQQSSAQTLLCPVPQRNKLELVAEKPVRKSMFGILRWCVWCSGPFFPKIFRRNFSQIMNPPHVWNAPQHDHERPQSALMMEIGWSWLNLDPKEGALQNVSQRKLHLLESSGDMILWILRLLKKRRKWFNDHCLSILG